MISGGYRVNHERLLEAYGGYTSDFSRTLLVTGDTNWM